jgi:hypothetical protein
MSYLWGHVKDVVYANEVPTCEELWQWILSAFH